MTPDLVVKAAQRLVAAEDAVDAAWRAAVYMEQLTRLWDERKAALAELREALK